MVATPRVAQAIKRDLNEAGLAECYRKRVNRLLPIALEMQRNRLRLDRSWHERLGNLLKTERELRQQELDRITGRAINVKSTPQVAALLLSLIHISEPTRQAEISY